MNEKLNNCKYCNHNDLLNREDGIVKCNNCNSTLFAGGSRGVAISNDELDYDRLYGKNDMSFQLFSNTFSVNWQNVDALVKKVKILNDIEPCLKNVLVFKCTQILHHCSIIWSGFLNAGKAIKKTIQLPKDCVLRIAAVVYYVIHFIPDIYEKVSVNEILKSFYGMLKSRKKRSVFNTGISNFISIIQEYDLSGPEYLDMKKRFKLENTYEVVNVDLIKEFTIDNMYSQILKGFFVMNNELEEYFAETQKLYKYAMHNVVLEGKGPRLTMAIAVFMIVKCKSFEENLNMTQSVNKVNKKQRVSKTLSKDELYQIVLKIISENKKLYDDIQTVFFIYEDANPKLNDRRKCNFAQGILKIINYLTFKNDHQWKIFKWN